MTPPILGIDSGRDHQPRGLAVSCFCLAVEAPRQGLATHLMQHAAASYRVAGPMPLGQGCHGNCPALSHRLHGLSGDVEQVRLLPYGIYDAAFSLRGRPADRGGSGVQPALSQSCSMSVPQRGAIADQCHHPAVGKRELDADCRQQTPADAAHSLPLCTRRRSTETSASLTGLIVAWRCTVAAGSRSIRAPAPARPWAIGRSRMCSPSCGATKKSR